MQGAPATPHPSKGREERGREMAGLQEPAGGLEAGRQTYLISCPDTHLLHLELEGSAGLGQDWVVGS